MLTGSSPNIDVEYDEIKLLLPHCIGFKLLCQDDQPHASSNTIFQNCMAKKKKKKKTKG